METIEIEHTDQVLGMPTENDGMPDSVAEFIDRFELPEKFRIILKRTGGGEKGIIREYKADEVDQAEFDVVGREFGPAKYQWNISWYDPAQKKSPMRSFTRELTSDVYLDAYKDTMEAKQRLKEAKEGSPKGLSGEDVMMKASELADKQFKSALQLSRELSTPATQDMTPMIQLMMNQQQSMMQMQMESRNQTMQMFTGLATALAPALISLLNKPQAPQHIGNDPMGMFDKALATVASMIDMKNALKGEEQPSMVDKIATLVSDNLPTVLSIVEMNKEQREKSMAMKVINNSTEMKAMEESPELKAQAIEKVADKIGLEDTKKVIDALGWNEFDGQIDEAIAHKNAMVKESEDSEEVEPTFS